jgi:translation elongation factor EF-4
MELLEKVNPLSSCEGAALILDGTGDKVTYAVTGKTYEVNDVGILHPDPISLPANSRLRAGQVGWITCGMKDATEGQLKSLLCVRSVDSYACPRQHTLATLYIITTNLSNCLKKWKKQFLWCLLASIRPRAKTILVWQRRSNGYIPQSAFLISITLTEIRSIQLTLTDRSIILQPAASPALGQGFRLGFLGALHLDVCRQRLLDEYGAEVIVTKPFVPIRGQ